MRKKLNDVRFSDCDIYDGSCVGSRKRFEFRPEASRRQGIRILGMGDTGRKGRTDRGHPIIGNVHWHGEAYPSRVTIDCDLENLDLAEACRVAKVENRLAQSELIWSESSPHDQCRLDSFKISGL